MNGRQERRHRASDSFSFIPVFGFHHELMPAAWGVFTVRGLRVCAHTHAL